MIEVVLRIAGVLVMAAGVLLVAIFYANLQGLAASSALFVVGAGLLRLSKARHDRVKSPGPGNR